MTSQQKINANRANARASTGPNTKHGQAHSAKNALRHALSLPVDSNPILSKEIETLALEIAGPGADAEMQKLARQVAEAQIDLRRVRFARHQMLSCAQRDPYFESRAKTQEKMRFVMRLLQRNAPDVPMAWVTAYLTSIPEGSLKLATILSELAKKLAAIDRYERRTLSRRKFAIRAFEKHFALIN